MAPACWSREEALPSPVLMARVLPQEGMWALQKSYTEYQPFVSVFHNIVYLVTLDSHNNLARQVETVLSGPFYRAENGFLVVK
jgi:hypothetical protein